MQEAEFSHNPRITRRSVCARFCAYRSCRQSVGFVESLRALSIQPYRKDTPRRCVLAVASASAWFWIFVVCGFDEHWIQAVVLEKPLVVNGELFGRVDRDDRRATI